MAEEQRVETTTTQTTAPIRGERIDVERTDYYDDRRPLIDHRVAANIVKRVSWGAIFAGVVMTLVIQLMLSILGLGIGASTVNPATEQNPVAGLGTGAGIWFAVTVLISLLAGGWVAGRLAGIPRVIDSLLHGLLTWGLATLLLFYFLTSTVGAIIGGTFSVFGSGLSAVTTGAAAIAPTVAGAAQDQLKKSGVDFDFSSVRSEIETTLKQTRKPELQPNAIKNQANTAVNQTQNTATDAASDPATSDDAVSSLLDRIQKSGSATFNAADRDALVNVVMAKTGKSRPEAEATVNSYQQTYQKAYQQYEQTKAQAAQTAREVEQKTADGVASAATWAFIALLLSALAAALGGFLATPKDVPARVETHTV